MSQMRVLVACEFSGIVRDAFRARGHDAWSCDLLPTEREGPHIQGDCIDAILSRKWDLILMYLPCTKIALCGNSTYGRGMPKHAERIEAMSWTARVWYLATKVCGKVMWENPKNVMGPIIGKRTQAIQPYQFGHLEQKETWLWLHSLPQLMETNNVYQEMMKLPKKERERIHYMSPSANRGQERSRTFCGVAKAKAEQWGSVV